MNHNTNHSFISSSICCILAALSMVISACSDHDDHDETKSPVTHVCRVAVLLEGDDLPWWKKTAEWALENMAAAQQGLNDRVQLQLEFKDQDAPDIDEYMRKIASDTTIHAIIGPCSSPSARKMATYLSEAIEQNPLSVALRKPMISPTATSVEYQRMFSGKDYVWNMAECDIYQLEIIVSTIARQSLEPLRTVTLLAPSEANSLAEDHSVYADWFGFIAEEYGLNIQGMLHYDNTDELRQMAHSLPTGDISALFNSIVFVPGTIEDALAFDDELNKMLEAEETRDYYYPSVYCSDLFVSPTVADNLNTNPKLSYEGVNLCAWPESGFYQAYHQHFNVDMMNGEAQFYDALCLVAYADMLSQHSELSLNQAVRAVVDGDNGTARGCFTEDMRQIFSKLQQFICPAINGASGPWKFDPKYHTNRLQSTFRHWRFFQGKFVTIGYITSEKTSYSTSSQDIWKWTPSIIDDLDDDEGSEYNYPPLSDRWALIVAGSTGWMNYRFQADAFAMYQILRNNGYDDDHIVFIANDDLANNPNNTNDPGAIRISELGENLYNSTAIDYQLDEVSQDDIGDILQGKASERLRHVINASPNDNIYIFWSSHGSPGKLDFGDQRSMRYSTMKEILASTPHRKMLVCLEACYAGGLGEQCKGLPGTLFLTAASPYEESHATGWSDLIGVYLTNCFTDAFQETILLNPHISLRNLYYSLARSVAGSHVKIYNQENYGNIYYETMQEYLK